MRKQLLSVTIAVFFLFSMIPSTRAGTDINSLQVKNHVYLRTGEFIPGPADNSTTSGALYLIHLTGPVQDSWKKHLSDKGAALGDYIPDFAFLAQMSPEVRDSVALLDFVSSVTPFKPSYKIDKSIGTGQNGKTALKITLFGSNKDSVLKTIRELRGSVVHIEGQTLTVTVPNEKITELAGSSDVVYMENAPEFKLFNDKAAPVIGAPAAWNNNLQGRGQVLGIADTGLDSGQNDSTMHKDFQGRIKAIYSSDGSSAADSNGHGTHVAGSAVGSGAMSNGLIKGIAPQAQLVFQSIMRQDGGLNIPADLGQLFAQAYAAGARIHSDSWGTGQNAYDYAAQSVDRYIWNNNDMSIVFAAGNNGDFNKDGQTDYNTISSPGTAKNVITVGASENNRPEMGSISDNTNQVAFFSSRGNTSDGRLKPDVVTPGTNILSAKSSKAPGSGPYNNAYTYMSGTSMATPLTAGAAVLAREYFTANLGVTPKASLIKAALINWAQDTGSWYPSKDQGWGRTNLVNLFPASPEGFKFDNESTPLSTGGSKEYTYTVTSSATPFKVSVVWTDYPGSTAASKALVNDLDLTVTGPNGTVYNGNDFNAPFNDNIDRLNNVENVFIKSPQTGVYKIIVKGYNVPTGPQSYSLVVSGTLGSGAPSPQPNPNPAPNPGTETVNITQTGYVNSSYSPAYKLSYIDVTQPGEVRLNLKWWNSTDLDLYLFDPDWNLVSRSAAKNNPESIVFNTTKTGRYCIKVNAYSGGAAYVLTASHPVSAGKTAVLSAGGRLDSAADRNRFYDLTIGSAGSVNIQVSFDNTNQTDFDLYLYDADWNLIAKAASGWYRNPETISYPVDRAGPYHVQVKAYRGASDFKIQAVYPK